MRAGIDVSQVEAATKIRAKYLRAIENEEWDLLPGPTFVKSFLRTYADFLGIDGRMLVEEYKLRYESPRDVELRPIGPPLGGDRQRPLRPPRVSRGWIVGLAVLGVLALLIVLGSIGEDDPAPVAETATRPARPAPRPPPATPAPERRPTRVALRLIPQGEVYVCLRDAADKLLVNSALSSGSAQPTYRSRRFRLTVGNSAIRMRVNGRTLSVASSPDPTNYELTPAGRRELSDEQNAC